MIISARVTDADGTIAVTLPDSDEFGNPTTKEWHGLTPASRFWPEYEDWLAEPNTPTPFVAPTPPVAIQLTWLVVDRDVAGYEWRGA